MRVACIILSVVIFLAIMAVCVMVKFSTDITVQERKREFEAQDGETYHYTRTMGVIALHDNSPMPVALRFPYVAAITKNSSTLWSFACFASVVLVKWVVTSAHCRRPEATHRVLLFHDFARNYTHTYSILFWRLHEKFNKSDPTSMYDIAVAKLNVEPYPVTIRPSVFDEKMAYDMELALWKTVAAMNRKLYLTNDFEYFGVTLVYFDRCFEAYGVPEEVSLICIDFTGHDDCFIHEFGPLYSDDKIVGLLSVKPKDCDTKLAIFTNVSYFTNWLLKSTHSTYYV